MKHLRLQYGLGFHVERRCGRRWGRVGLLRQVGRGEQQHVLSQCERDIGRRTRNGEAASTTIVAARSHSPSFVNNIIAGNDVANSDGLGFYSKNAQTISYHCFHGNTGGNYTANVTSTNEELGDPSLADPAGGDFSLMYNSSCIEEGDPIYTVPENGAWVVDIGAIEYTGTRHWRPVRPRGFSSSAAA